MEESTFLIEEMNDTQRSILHTLKRMNGQGAFPSQAELYRRVTRLDAEPTGNFRDYLWQLKNRGLVDRQDGPRYGAGWFITPKGREEIDVLTGWTREGACPPNQDVESRYERMIRNMSTDVWDLLNEKPMRSHDWRLKVAILSRPSDRFFSSKMNFQTIPLNHWNKGISKDEDFTYEVSPSHVTFRPVTSIWTDDPMEAAWLAFDLTREVAVRMEAEVNARVDAWNRENKVREKHLKFGWFDVLVDGLPQVKVASVHIAWLMDPIAHEMAKCGAMPILHELGDHRFCYEQSDCRHPATGEAMKWPEAEAQDSKHALEDMDRYEGEVTSLVTQEGCAEVQRFGRSVAVGETTGVVEAIQFAKAVPQILEMVKNHGQQIGDLKELMLMQIHQNQSVTDSIGMLNKTVTSAVLPMKRVPAQGDEKEPEGYG